MLKGIAVQDAKYFKTNIMIEIRRKTKITNHHLRKIDPKTEQRLAFDYFNYDKTPSELSKEYGINNKTITSILQKWEPIPKIKRIPIFVTEDQLEQIKFLNIGFERFEKDTEIIQYKESKINNNI